MAQFVPAGGVHDRQPLVLGPHGIGNQKARDAGDGVLARTVDIGDHQDVGRR